MTLQLMNYKMLFYLLPVVQNLWDLSSGLVGPIAAQATGAEGKGHTIRALHCGHASVPISCPAAIVSQSDSILYPFLCQINSHHGTIYNHKWIMLRKTIVM